MNLSELLLLYKWGVWAKRCTSGICWIKDPPILPDLESWEAVRVDTLRVRVNGSRVAVNVYRITFISHSGSREVFYSAENIGDSLSLFKEWLKDGYDRF